MIAVLLYLITVHCVLGGAGCDRDCVRLAAGITLTVCIFSRFPKKKKKKTLITNFICDTHSTIETCQQRDTDEWVLILLKYIKKESVRIKHKSVYLRNRDPPLADAALSGRGFGWMYGLLERPLQVDSSLLNHLPDVSNPLLFYFYTRGLQRRREMFYHLTDTHTHKDTVNCTRYLKNRFVVRRWCPSSPQSEFTWIPFNVFGNTQF